MNKLIALLAISTALSGADVGDVSDFKNTYEYGVDVFGKSFHTKSGFNEWNPGVGAWIYMKEKISDDVSFGACVNAGYYVDSYNERARYVIPGMILQVGNPHKWHSDLSIGVGYFEGSSNRGIGPGTCVSYGYNRVLLCASVSPKNGPATTNAMAFWMRVRVGEF